ncbi:MAG TPA: hypothetical protein V6D48_10820 [Oculatellaceae cyanobacterium]
MFTKTGAVARTFNTRCEQFIGSRHLCSSSLEGHLCDRSRFCFFPEQAKILWWNI